jgi:DNA-binding NarL/FixJ family response regulator
LHAQRQKLAGLAGSAGAAIRILIADDIEAWHWIYAGVLSRRPDWKIVGIARNVVEAVQKSRELNPDVVLLEMDLERMDGLETARQIRQVAASSRIVFVGFDDPYQALESVSSTGAYGYIVKRNVVLDLVPALEAITEGQRFFSRQDS